LDKPNVFLTALKRAEDSRGVIIRLIETDGQATDATLTIPAVAVEKAWRTNLVEENQEELTCTEHSVTVPVGSFAITTLRLQALPR
jgi:alpha-mannosidase